jgi:hypothetical protein
MPGGVAGAQSKMAAPYADSYHLAKRRHLKHQSFDRLCLDAMDASLLRDGQKVGAQRLNSR